MVAHWLANSWIVVSFEIKKSYAYTPSSTTINKLATIGYNLAYNFVKHSLISASAQSTNLQSTTTTQIIAIYLSMMEYKI